MFFKKFTGLVEETGVEDDHPTTSEEPEDITELAEQLEEMAPPGEEEEDVFNKDQILLEGCYRAIKTSIKKTDLPILTSAFYSQHVKVGTLR